VAMAEWNMCTLILGQGKFEGLVGNRTKWRTWFQHVLASNESSTVDGRRFTSFLEDLD
jgi:hypothetical protein